MAVQSSGSGSASLSVFPDPPVIGQPNAEVTASFSGSVYNDGQPNDDGSTDQDITFSWSIGGDLSNSGTLTQKLRAKDNFSAFEQTAMGTFQGPTTETASFEITCNGSVIVSGQTSLYIAPSPAG